MTKRSCLGCGADLTGMHGKRKWCSERCRRRTSYGGTCKVCGERTDGSAGRAKAPKRCIRCERERTLERDERIRVLWEEGTPTAAIAQGVGLTAAQVRAVVDHCRRKKGESLSFRNLPRRDAAERYERIAAMIREGLTDAEIAEELGTSRASVGMMASRARKRGFDMPYRPSAT